jgi:integrase
MGTVYPRGKTLWIAYKDANGERQWETTGLPLDMKEKARKVLDTVERKVEAEREFIRDGGEAKFTGPLTVRVYGERWVEQRKGINEGKRADQRARLRNYIFPVLGEIPLKDLRPKHVRALAQALGEERSVRHGRKLAPRTILGIIRVLHTMLRDARIDELIDSNPCELKRGDVPSARDNDPRWRSGAIFTRDEVELLLGQPDIPDDLRMMIALLFLTGARIGEVLALRWRDYAPEMKPLGRLLVEKSWNSRLKQEVPTKTKQPRNVPVHPLLAKYLAEWKLGGWARHCGRAPEPDDLIVPRADGTCQFSCGFHRQLVGLLASLGMRKRRTHDTRRTFITLAQVDGAPADKLKWITHGPTESIIDVYTTLPWEFLCALVSPLKVSPRAGGDLLTLAV